MTSAKAIVYSEHGQVSDVLHTHSYTLADPQSNEVLILTVVAPVNPADILQVIGTYPARPEKNTKLGTAKPSAVGGNEGLFKVLKVGSAVKHFKTGDWCIPRVPGLGTWRSHILCDSHDVIPLPSFLSLDQAATIGVNPLTAYQLLTQFVYLKKGDWVIQNAGNSAVGKLVTQIARVKGINSISVVRNRDNLTELVEELTALGATKVITDEQNYDESFQATISEWVGDSKVRLALNCVSGKSASALVKKLSKGGFVVTYGLMDQSDLNINISITDYVFKQITSTGYWLTANIAANPQLKIDTLDEICKYYEKGLVVSPPFKKVLYKLAEDDAKGSTFLETMLRVVGDKSGKQALLFE
ncbi:hypothetical protein BABINDRAFT_6002 [Babjeviella inositovora NRRL Y-12698]|uniref:enoyl-[acyl-carrier-protein] reductase n=1 Tax=Babjeviella inositovora NRRL Y-12698 TaxID=984486 RepID=A0A1E3R008_9ASCO|nr:uncharacterized protein BABINDRAFT_6002 [Babjeviella inositovora NRRL Y-12698]ODQ83144.1 hypothetical protein BABINDRAFT_6002 [Babjeviella inositovora NRRL Y-12698]